MNYKYKFCIWLVDSLLNNKRSMTFKKIQEKWKDSSFNPNGEVLTLRSFYRYKQDAQSLFNVDILCDKKNGSTYWIDASTEFHENKPMQWLMNGLRISNIQAACKDSSKIILEPAPVGIQRLQTIIEAIEDKNTLNITYKSHYGEPKEHQFIPVFIRLFKQRWYVIGQDIELEQPITFALERICELSHQEEARELSENLVDILDPETYFTDCYGIIRKHNPIKIQFRAFWPQNLYLKDLPIHESQILIDETENHSDFEIYVRPTYDLKQELLWNRDKLAVLAPESFRQDMIAILEATLKGYQTGDSYAVNE